MREIKFRAWDSKAKAMVNCASVPVGMFSKYDDPYMQYTGLKDKNGKEIYEGDVVAYGNRGNKQVGFLQGEFVLLNPQGKFYDSVGNANKELEIIGNIYENPELLAAPTHN